MRKLKRSYKLLTSVVLLLSFSVTILPLDLFHNHSFKDTRCQEERLTGTCHHKVHVSEKTPFCWVCGIHYDKTFDKQQTAKKFESLPVVSFFLENHATKYIAELLFTALRGPPSGS
ncbi:hypothetical protein FW774_01470 (plasmid) [Pedobacter sp. BS3]|uniref:hypothetical protein n=1 Tax=Pedobacter sp. BS3 TaxID=2567937 RepID=UPI0011EDF3B4|nr:hypothetical protein [Pedobacter sp. BS3]TZF85768.1 hypothetical protein FW774_01470 [Pedobacter sp. BS3]